MAKAKKKASKTVKKSAVKKKSKSRATKKSVKPSQKKTIERYDVNQTTPGTEQTLEATAVSTEEQQLTTQKPTTDSTSVIAQKQSLLDSSILYQAESELTDKEEEKKENVFIRLIMPYILVPILTFIIGIFIFLPLNDIARQLISRIQSPSMGVSVKDIDVSYSGNIDIDGLVIDEASLGLQFKASKVNVKTSFWDAVMVGLKSGSQLSLNTLAQVIKVKHRYVDLEGVSLQVISTLQNLNKGKNRLQARLKIEGKSMTAKILDLPFGVGDIDLIIESIKLYGNLKSNTIQFAKGKQRISTNLFDLTFDGSIALIKNGQIKLNVTIDTKESFKTYRNGEIYESLSFMIPTLKDQKVEFQLNTDAQPPFKLLGATTAKP